MKWIHYGKLIFLVRTIRKKNKKIIPWKILILFIIFLAGDHRYIWLVFKQPGFLKDVKDPRIKRE